MRPKTTPASTDLVYSGAGVRPRSGGLVRYVVAATLARGADGGAAVGLVLLATTTRHLSRPSLIGGLLATCLTAPHLLGPAVARLLDRARDGRRLLAAACIVYGLALTAASTLLGEIPVVLVATLVAVAGLCGPLLTGGLSSRLAGLVSPDEPAQRRAQGWDAVTYGIGGSAGPAAVAALAAAATLLVSRSAPGRWPPPSWRCPCPAPRDRPGPAARCSRCVGPCA